MVSGYGVWNLICYTVNCYHETTLYSSLQLKR
jgi:hypothetical protein